MKILLLILFVIFIILINYNINESFSNDLKINVITSFYVVKKNQDRTNELKKSLQNNINHNYVEKVYLFLDRIYFSRVILNSLLVIKSKIKIMILRSN